LSEECNEVGQRCSKAIRFGMNETQPSKDQTNFERLSAEFQDLIAVADLLGLSIDSERVEAKKRKIEKYGKYSKELGILKENL